MVFSLATESAALSSSVVLSDITGLEAMSVVSVAFTCVVASLDTSSVEDDFSELAMVGVSVALKNEFKPLYVETLTFLASGFLLLLTVGAVWVPCLVFLIAVLVTPAR